MRNLRPYANEDAVKQAGRDAYDLQRAGWADADNPTEAEQASALDARLAAEIAAAQELAAGAAG